MKKYQKTILKKMGLNPTKEVRDDLRGKNLDKYHYLRLKMFGIKKYDYFEIFERDTENIFSNKNITEWDKKEYKYQKEHLTDVRKEYDSLYIQPIHFMAIEKENYKYGLLESLRWYILEAVLENIRNMVEEKYPTPKEYIDFENIERKALLRVMNKQKDRLPEHKELIKKVYASYHDMDDYIVENIKDLSGFTFFIEGGEFMEGLNYYIIGGFEASDNINFKTFFNDFNKLKKDSKIIDERIKKITIFFKEKLII